MLVEASQLTRFDRVVALAREHKNTEPELWRRVENHARFVSSKEGEKALSGGLVRLALVIGEAWRSVLTPRTGPTGQAVGMSLTNAIRERAIVLWRTHVDVMPDEAKTVTAIILNDIHASAVEAQQQGPALWTCVLDEFGAIVATAADQALALLQRGRTHEGQVLVVTQSIADIEALTDQPGMLASMADNFSAFMIHRQSAPESRDWLAKLMGTTALWQSTDQTSAHAATGAGSRRRVGEFRISSDTFSELRVGEAVIHTTLEPPPRVSRIRPVQVPTRGTLQRIAPDTPDSCEITVHPAIQLPTGRSPKDRATALPRSGEPSTVAAPRPAGALNAASANEPGEDVPGRRRQPPDSFEDA